MNAMVLSAPGGPLELSEIKKPIPGKGQVLVRVNACGVCRTDLHVVDGELPHPKLPLVPGHQIVGVVEACGEPVEPACGEPAESGAGTFRPGDRVGIPWLGGSCGACDNCRRGRENLCDKALYTGYQVDGGFAEYCVADARFAFPIPPDYPDLQAAPLLCAGLIGWRAYKMAGEGQRLGFYGFGAAAHLLLQMARHQGREVYAFTRPGDGASQAFARELGAAWAGASMEAPPRPLDAALIFAPAGELVPAALKAVARGGTVVCAGIHMSDIPSFPYSALWGERTLKSVANLTRKDGEEFLRLAPRIPIRSRVTAYPLEKTNQALDDLRSGNLQGAAVVKVSRTAKGGTTDVTESAEKGIDF